MIGDPGDSIVLKAISKMILWCGRAAVSEAAPPCHTTNPIVSDENQREINKEVRYERQGGDLFRAKKKEERSQPASFPTHREDERREAERLRVAAEEARNAAEFLRDTAEQARQAFLDQQKIISKRRQAVQGWMNCSRSTNG